MFPSTINKSKLIQTAKTLLNTNSNFQKAEIYLHLTLLSFPDKPDQTDSINLITTYSLLSFINYKRCPQSISTSLWLLSKLKSISITHIKDNQTLISYIKAFTWCSLIIREKHPFESLYYITYVMNTIKSHNIKLKDDYKNSIDAVYKECLLKNDMHVQRYLKLNEQYNTIKQIVNAVHNSNNIGKDNEGCWVINRKWFQQVEKYINTKQNAYLERSSDDMFNDNEIYVINNESLITHLNSVTDNDNDSGTSPNVSVNTNELENTMIISNDIYLQIKNVFGILFPLPSSILHKHELKQVQLLILDNTLLNAYPEQCLLTHTYIKKYTTYHNLYTSLFPSNSSSHKLCTCNSNNELLFTLLFLYYHNIPTTINIPSNELEPVLHEQKEYPSNGKVIIILHTSSSSNNVLNIQYSINNNKCCICNSNNNNNACYKCKTFSFMSYLHLTYCNEHCKHKDASHKHLHHHLRPFIRKQYTNNNLIHKLSSHNTNIKGLINTGNTCYINSILQSLAHTPHFLTYFLYRKYLNDINTNHSDKAQLAEQLYNVFHSMWLSSTNSYNNAVSPLQFIYTFNSLCKNFVMNEQHDASEFLTYLLDLLHECLNRIEYKPYIEINESSYSQCITAFKQRDDSLITDLFQGMFQSSITCNTCKTTRYIYEQFTTLSLPLIPTNHALCFYVYNTTSHSLKQHTINITSLSTVTPSHLITAVNTHNNTLSDYDIMLIHSDNTIHSVITPSTYDDVRLCDVITALPALKIVLYERQQRKENIYITPVSYAIEYKLLFIPYNKLHVHSFPYAVSVCNRNITIQYVYEYMYKQVNDSNIRLLMWNYLKKEVCDYCGCLNCEMCDMLQVFQWEDKVERLMRKRSCSSEAVVMACEVSCGSVNFGKVEGTACTRSVKDNSDATIDLEDCLKEFLKEEVLDGENMWYCSNCNEKRSAVKQMSICKLPMYLVIQLKRFGSEGNGEYDGNHIENVLQIQDMLDNNNGNSGNNMKAGSKKKGRKKHKKKNNASSSSTMASSIMNNNELLLDELLQSTSSMYSTPHSQKNNTSISFPITNLNISQYIHTTNSLSSPSISTYNLYSIINHYGNLSNGHYTSTSLHFPSNTWYNYDDSTVSPHPLSSPYSSSTAYLLFYKQQCP